MFSLATLSKLIPFRDYVYAAAAVALTVYYNVHVHELEVRYARAQVVAVEKADKEATDRTLRAAKDALDAKDAAYKRSLAQQEITHAQELKSRNDAYAADIVRLRQLSAASGRGHGPGVGGTGGASTGSGQVDSGPDGLGFVPAKLGAELADALRATRDQRELCYAERDSLTGK